MSVSHSPRLVENVRARDFPDPGMTAPVCKYHKVCFPHLLIGRTSLSVTRSLSDQGRAGTSPVFVCRAWDETHVPSTKMTIGNAYGDREGTQPGRCRRVLKGGPLASARDVMASSGRCTVAGAAAKGSGPAPWLDISEHKGAWPSRLLAHPDLPADASSGSPLDKGCEADLPPTPRQEEEIRLSAAFRQSPRPSYGKVFQSLMN